jgi:hypothetical protein
MASSGFGEQLRNFIVHTEYWDLLLGRPKRLPVSKWQAAQLDSITVGRLER